MKSLFSVRRDKNNDFDYVEIKRLLRKNQEILEKRDQEEK